MAEPAIPFQPLIGEPGQVPFPVQGQNAAANAALLQRLRSANVPRVPTAQEQQVSTPEQAAATIAAMRAKAQQAGPAAQQSTVPPTSEAMPGQDRYTHYEGRDYTKNTKGDKVFIFSPDSKGATVEDFGNVIQQYNTSGGTDIKSGWAIVPPGKVATARMAFNSARDKLQKYAQESGSAIGKGVIAPLAVGARLNEALGISERGAGQRVSNIGAKAGGAVGRFAASPLDNPETALSTLATFLATRGSSNLSLAPAAIKAALASATGYTAGGLATGSDIGLKGALTEGLIAAASSGAPAVFQSALNRLPSQRAKQQIIDGITDELKKTYGPISNDPQTMKAMLDTKSGISTAVQKGIKSIIGDFEQTGGKLLDSILDITRGNLSTGPTRIVTNRVKEMGRLATDLINATGDPVKWRSVRRIYDTARRELIDTVTESLSGTGKPNAYYNRIVSQVNQAVNNFDSTLTAYRPALELFDILKKAGADKQIIIRELQQQLQGISHTSSELVENVGKIAGRGADLTRGIDKKYSVGTPQALLNLLGIKFPGSAQLLDKARIPIGQGYVGKVRGTLPGTSATAAVATQQGIRSFLAEDKK